MKTWQKRTKRARDVLLAAAGFVVLSPVLLGVAVAVRLAMGRPILFRQQRPGLHGMPFEIMKFRTMIPPREGEDASRTDAKRLTRLGRMLRRTSLDELPELWNVLRGDMSLVGPRPLLMRYLPYFTQREMRRHAVRPGMTGWAQIHGRNEASWEERLANDAWYVENWSLGLDLRILLATARHAVLGTGVVVNPRSAMKNLDEERSPGASPSIGS
jgi:sugar transferase EpsL